MTPSQLLRALAWALAAVMVPSAPAMPARGAPAPHAVAAPALGVSWYPEQWPEERWGVDLDLMQRAGVTVVRVGEFAWARMEPSDGRFDFDWLDRAIAAAARRGIRVVVGTPTAAPPIWLTEAHADVLRVNEDGSVEGHGERRQFSFASATYRRYAHRIAERLGARYGRNPDVVGWQIDNEIGVPSFDREAKARWADWLRARYQTVDALNRRWTTMYWSQRYDRFDQVPLRSTGAQNPALLLDFRRFVSDLWADYVGGQASAIRAHADPRQFVTTNSTAWNNNFDQYRVHAGLDLAAWDDYVPNGRPDWPANAMHHDLVRGYKQRNFWVMETQPGRVDWAPLNRALEPGQVRELAWQAVGHGADAVVFWQWRSALNGQEQYHGTLLGPDGEPMPIFAEIARIGAEFKAAASALSGTAAAAAEVAILYSQESRWAVESERHHRDYDPVAVMKDWYRPFAAGGRAIDVIGPEADLSRYRLVLAPNLNVLDAALADRLAAYVRGGGQLVLGPRSGMKDGDNALWTARQPGPLASLLGARVENYYPLDVPVALAGPLGPAEAATWAEAIEPRAGDVETLASYAGGGWLAGRAAIVARSAGRGRITYVGAQLRPEGQRRLTQDLISRAALTPPPAAPAAGVEMVERVGPTGRFLIVINHNDRPTGLSIPQRARRLLGDGDGKEMPAHGIAVWSLDADKP